ncbi:MAG: sodium:solute symporter family protein [Gemmatimonadetes bacterium]|nr:sodium:solute symporter family protein [Gemmatimonadota bacterium]
MHPLDLAIFVVYMLGMLGVGAYFLRRNESVDDYYVGGRGMSATHVGFSVVATDVGGGFSIGLGGLGFVMGLSGSWLLFTGFVGAWVAAAWLVPRVRKDPRLARALTFPDFLGRFFGSRVALLAGIVSAVGYAGFTASQILAGAKLASGSLPSVSFETALLVMGGVAIGYTVLGGLKAVIYTDSVQWAIVLGGLTFVAVPMAFSAVGGFDAIRATVHPELLSLSNIRPVEFVNWMVTIVPIWFVGMTLYQRIYACRDEPTARRAWLLAGVLEWPLMAFLGSVLGLLARVAADQGMFGAFGADGISDVDPETGLPMLLRTVMPPGVLGIVLAAYFSAILSTADSCLMAASGNVVNDIIERRRGDHPSAARTLRMSQIATLVIGAIALLLASRMTSVLDLMLYSYALMVSGLFVPVIAALTDRRPSPVAAGAAIIAGGATTVALQASGVALPLGLDSNCFGLAVSAITYLAVRRFGTATLSSVDPV